MTDRMEQIKSQLTPLYDATSDSEYYELSREIVDWLLSEVERLRGELREDLRVFKFLTNEGFDDPLVKGRIRELRKVVGE